MNIREERRWTREALTRHRLQHRKTVWAHVKGCPNCRHRLLAEPLPEGASPFPPNVEVVFGGRVDACPDFGPPQNSDDTKVH